MKKSVMKKFSLLMAVVLLISMMPFTVFAAEDGHAHDGTCCAESNVAAPYASCTHPSMTSYIYGVYNGEKDSATHTYDEYVRYTCVSCNYKTLPTATGNEWKESHNYKLSNGGVAAACTVCGHVKGT